MIDRYTREEMKQLWSEEHKFQVYLEVELQATQAFMKLGVVPKEDYEKIRLKAQYSLKRIHELEQETKHDVIAFTRAVSESLGEEKKWIHYGLTSTDIVDTAQSVILQKVNYLLENGLEKLLEVLRKKALLYKDVPCIGRTHGIHADITSFGLKYALWYDEIKRQLIRFHQARTDIEVGKISGAVGNFANAPTFIQEEVCKSFNLQSSAISTQVLQRDRHAFYLNVLALIGASIEKIATELRHLQRTEVHEVEEGFAKGQKGSSAMPHKKNPISSENLSGCARVLRGYAFSSFENIALWHERDISHSSVERIILPDATTLLDYMLERMVQVLEHLQVFPEKMIENIYLTNGVIFSQRVLTELINKGMSREEAYDLVQTLVFECMSQKRSFQDKLKDHPIIKTRLSKVELDKLFDLQYFLRNVDEIYQRVDLLP